MNWKTALAVASLAVEVIKVIKDATDDDKKKAA